MSITGTQTTRFVTATTAALLMVLATLVAPAAVQAQTELDAGDGDEPTGTTTIDASAYGTAAELSVAISRELPTDAPVSEVLIARDDDFADALASGGMQGTRPLLLVPGQGSLPAVVADEIARLGVDRAVVLGGTAAVGEQIVSDLGAMDIQVERVFGPDRIATAVEIAEHMPPSDTVILARAYGSTDNPTQAFADALAAGAMGAETGWPILLTDSGVLSSRTRELITAGVEHVYIVGGTAAIGQAVEEQVEELSTATRIAGPNRFGTAVEIAKTTAEVVAERAPDTGTDSGWTLIEGTREGSWTAGFAVASVAAARNSPVLLATPDTLPTETEEHLVESRTPDQEQPIICIVSTETCELGRRGAGLPPAPIVQVRPGNGATVAAGANVLIAVDPIDLAAGRAVEISGCLAAAVPEGGLVADAGGNAVLQVPEFGESAFCDSTLRVAFANGEATTVTRSWVDGLPGSPGPGPSPDPDPTPGPGPDPDPDPSGTTVPITVDPVVTDNRAVPYPIVLRSSLDCAGAPPAVGPADQLILTGQATGLSEPSSVDLVHVQPPVGRAVAADGRSCQLTVTADSTGASVSGWSITALTDPTSPRSSGTGSTVPIDAAELSPDGAGLVVSVTVTINATAPVDTTWPASASDLIRVWKRDDLARLQCGSAIDVSAAVYTDVPAPTSCTVTNTAGQGSALVMALGHPLALYVQPTAVEVGRDRGPVTVWGGVLGLPSDLPDLPPIDDCPGIPEDPIRDPGIDIIPDCPR